MASSQRHQPSASTVTKSTRRRSSVRKRGRGEATSYYDRAQTFDSPDTSGKPDARNAETFQGEARPAEKPYGYSENQGEAGEIFTGLPPPSSYQQTLPETFDGVQHAGDHVTLEPDLQNHIHVANATTEMAQSQSPSSGRKYDGPTIKPGIRGSARGFLDLARKRTHVCEDTPARLELLRRADRFFGSKWVQRIGRLSKDKTKLFREEIERMEAKLGMNGE